MYSGVVSPLMVRVNRSDGTGYGPFVHGLLLH